MAKVGFSKQAFIIEEFPWGFHTGRGQFDLPPVGKFQWAANYLTMKMNDDTSVTLTRNLLATLA